MSKILTTQLSGLLQRINQREAESIEDTARLLAQAAIGQGNVYFACFGEMEGVALNAVSSADPMRKVLPFTSNTILTDVDRVCIFTRSGNDLQALALAKKLYEDFIPFAAVASEPVNEDNQLSELAYTYISLNVRGGILPHPTKLGERIVMPHLMAALFVYEAIKLEYDEMIDGDEDVEENSANSPFA